MGTHRIFHVLESQSWGGLEIYALDLIDRLNRAGVESALYCPRLGPVRARALELGIPMIDNLWRLRDSRWTHVHVHQRRSLAKVRALLTGKKTPFIYSLYMSSQPKRDLYHHWIYSRVHRVTSSSAWVCEKLINDYPIRPDKIELVRYGRPEILPSAVGSTPNLAARQELHAPSEARVLLSLSRLDPGKGILKIIQAYLSLPEEMRTKWHLWIIGDPTQKGIGKDGRPIYEKASIEFQEKIKTLSRDPRAGQLRILPFQKDYQKYLAACDLFFMGAFEETYSLAVIDAMLNGKPVLGAKSGGTVEQIGFKEERGFFFDRESQDSLTSTWINLDKNFAEVYEKGANALRWAALEHSWPRCLAHWQNIYANCEN